MTDQGAWCDPWAQPLAPPSVTEVREWTKASTSAVSDTQLSMVLAAETINQAALCRVVPYLPDLYQAILRRVARELAARGVPLGVLSGEAEYGATRLPSFDAEIERLEGPHRKVVFG